MTNDVFLSSSIVRVFIRLARIDDKLPGLEIIVHKFRLGVLDRCAQHKCVTKRLDLQYLSILFPIRTLRLEANEIQQ